MVPSSAELAPPADKSDRALVAAAATEIPDAVREQAKAAAEPLPSGAPTPTEAADDTGVANSLDSLCNALLTSAQDNHLPVSFFANLIWQESRLQHDAVSRAGALGIAQFMPQVAVEVGLDDPFDPRQAIPASARFLRALHAHFGNLGFAAAAYNAGAHRVGEWLDHHRALPRETQTYVVRVTGRSVEAWRKAPAKESKLALVDRMPCRELPAFAELEQAQLRQARQMAEAQPWPEKTAAKVAGVRSAARFAGRTAFARRLAAEPAAARKATRTVAAGKLARSLRGDRREAGHGPRIAHERRRVA